MRLPLLTALLIACAPESTPQDLHGTLSAQSLSDVALRFEGGRIATIQGSFPAASAIPEIAAVRFLEAQIPALGLHPETTFETLRIREGLRGTYVRLQQRHAGVPVHEAQAVVLVADDRIVEISCNLYPLEQIEGASTDAIDAEAIARAAVSGADLLFGGVTTELTPEGRPLHRVSLLSPGGEDWEIQIDGTSGEVLTSFDRRRFVGGTGLVFDPNPIAQSGDTTLTDNNDAASPTLDALRIAVNLSNLDGSGDLRGTWVDADQSGRANEPTFDYSYDRADDRFEEVMTYFHIDRTQERFQSLGFIDVNARQQYVNVNGSNIDNSWFTPATGEITLGRGGVDDGEDAEVIVHEYGHAVQDDQLGGWGSGNNAAGMGEGFSDYLASSIMTEFSAQTYDPLCMGEWDATSFGLDCIRRLDSTNHYPEQWGTGFFASPHNNGEIWSAALWSAREVVGGDVMDTIVLEHHFALTTNPSVADAAAAVLNTADALYGPAVRDDVRRALVWQGISQELSAPSGLSVVQNSIVGNITHPRIGGAYINNADHTVVITEPGAQGISAHFFGHDLQLNKDFVYLYDGAGNLYDIYTGLQLDFDSVVVPGDTLQVRLVSNGSGTDRGWLIDQIDTY
ncbi:MAG TPA: hypothetical protein ENK18_04290 [Deltaproteobacteria bacterium]|nr:hypothetical protein [Deltaproteobacteria bacterium]